MERMLRPPIQSATRSWAADGSDNSGIVVGNSPNRAQQTAAGRDLLDRYRDQVSALEEQMLVGLTRPQVSSLRRNLHACHTNVAGQRRG